MKRRPPNQQRTEEGDKKPFVHYTFLLLSSHLSCQSSLSPSIHLHLSASLQGRSRLTMARWRFWKDLLSLFYQWKESVRGENEVYLLAARNHTARIICFKQTLSRRLPWIICREVLKESSPFQHLSTFHHHLLFILELELIFSLEVQSKIEFCEISFLILISSCRNLANLILIPYIAGCPCRLPRVPLRSFSW